jgi:type I restriction enzyme S subunit
MSASWPLVSLGEVLRSVSRAEKVDPLKEYSLLGVRLDGQGPFLREKRLGSQISTSTLFRVEKGDFIYSRLFAWRGAFGIIDEPLKNCYVSGEFPTFRAHDDRIDLRYLKYWFRILSTLERVQADCTGSTPLTRNRFKEEFFLRLQIPLPLLTEQRRIVARVEELAAKIEEAKGLRKKAVEEVEAMLKSSMSVVFANPEWALLSVTEFCEQPQYGYTESATSEPVGPKFLRITDIQNGRVEWDKVPYCVCPDPEKYLLKKDDIVFARTGGTTGKSFLIGDCPPAVFASYLIRLRVRDRLSPEYLYSYFQSPSYWTQVLDERKGTGQPNVNGEKLAQIKVPIPSLDEQRRIVAYLDSLQSKVDALKQLQEETQKELDALLPSILDKAFKGELV